MITIDDMIDATKREIGMRHAVYARRVEAGRMTQAQMDFGIRVQEEILALLMEVRDGRAPLVRRRPQQGSLGL